MDSRLYLDISKLADVGQIYIVSSNIDATSDDCSQGGNFAQISLQNQPKNEFLVGFARN